MKFLSILILLFATPALALEEFILDGLIEPVQQDTATPANSKPLPVSPLNSSGVRVNPATEEKQDDIISELQDANASLLTIDQVLDDSLLVLQSLDAKDFATETTLLSAVGELQTLNAFDFATETTLSAIDTKLSGTITVQATNLDIRDLSSASDSVSAVQSGAWNITNITGTVSLPTGASTAALQTSGNASLTSIDGKLPSLGQKAMAGSVAVVVASDQSAIPVSTTQAQNTSTFAEITNLTTTAQTFTAPAGAIGFKLQAPSTNTQNVRFKVGAAATTTSGILMEPGRSEDFDVSSNVSVIAVSGSSQTVFIQWKVRP